ncbi:hypothetical protein GCM10022204_32280 [Microlunatus aurantiacus]|uniref:Bacterial bifunctional deaminase-reductase C-terminal domain-containing protein n=1 Tax=Microlunatus aurantiacus TaxID=446786 RepID=A0ABP7DWD1_9ACTN
MAAGRPHVTVYNEISLDGKITGFDGDGVRYYARGLRWPSDAILMGSVTAEAFGPNESAAEQERELPPPGSPSSSTSRDRCWWCPTAAGGSAAGGMRRRSPGTTGSWCSSAGRRRATTSPTSIDAAWPT